MKQLPGILWTSVIVLVVVIFLVPHFAEVSEDQKYAENELIGKVISIYGGIEYHIDLTIINVVNINKEEKHAIAYVTTVITKSPSVSVEIKPHPTSNEWMMAILKLENSTTMELPNRVNFKGWMLSVLYKHDFVIK